MTQATDDFDAARQIATILEPFVAGDRERVVRCALETLGQGDVLVSAAPQTTAPTMVDAERAQTRPNDIKSFVSLKNPKSDVQFATVAAHYHALEAPVDQRKPEVNKDDLLEASRLANWRRPNSPYKTLANAMQSSKKARPISYLNAIAARCGEGPLSRRGASAA